MNISIRKNLKTELQTLIKHWNLHVHTIIKDQIEIILSKKENDTTYFL
jgi:hypothetical protein